MNVKRLFLFQLKYHELFHENGQCFLLTNDVLQITRRWLNHFLGERFSDEIFSFCHQIRRLNLTDGELSLLIAYQIFNDGKKQIENIFSERKIDFLFQIQKMKNKFQWKTFIFKRWHEKFSSDAEKFKENICAIRSKRFVTFSFDSGWKSSVRFDFLRDPTFSLSVLSAIIDSDVLTSFSSSFEINSSKTLHDLPQGHQTRLRRQTSEVMQYYDRLYCVNRIAHWSEAKRRQIFFMVWLMSLFLKLNDRRSLWHHVRPM